jgi:hypothetical protein
MPEPLAWGAADDRYFQHGLDRGVLYSSVSDPVVWNGLTGMDENSDSSSAIHYVDGKVYMADVEPGDFSGTLSAYFWPEAFAECVGIPAAAEGFYLDNQKPNRQWVVWRHVRVPTPFGLQPDGHAWNQISKDRQRDAHTSRIHIRFGGNTGRSPWVSTHCALHSRHAILVSGNSCGS